uniref:Uncharacterized protein n=1 Tax=Papilio xuthus TaxID=66420 RepID=I4DQM7_PAPXU|nr:unknown unsecreted protein [Papilio xuthus]
MCFVMPLSVTIFKNKTKPVLFVVYSLIFLLYDNSIQALNKKKNLKALVRLKLFIPNLNYNLRMLYR